MRRVVAALLIPALLGVANLVGSLHTHAYDAHQHPEHDHGLAAHEHHVGPVRGPGTGPVVERCDPGRHAKAFAFIATAPLPIPTIDATLIPAVLTVPPPPVERTKAPADVRVHGPPPRAPSSARAPPPSFLA